MRVAPMFAALLMSQPAQAHAQGVHEATAVADAMAAEVGSLPGWPPYLALNSLPRAVRRSWQNELASAQLEDSLPEAERVLAAVLSELLQQAEAFTACDWFADDLRVPPRCYRAWLRYHLGDDITAETVLSMASIGPELPSRMRALNPLAKERYPVADSLLSEEALLEAVQGADELARTVSQGLFPLEAIHDRVSISWSNTGPLAMYGGAGHDGTPVMSMPRSLSE